MRIFFNPGGKFIILLIILYQLLNSSCSKKFYPEPTFRNIENQADKRKLNDFMNEGTGKAINTHNIKPDEIILTAKKYLGVPHCMGGRTMKCMDCSGLLVTVFAQHGIHLPHSSEEQARYGEIMTSSDQLKAGDLVFFTRSYKTHRFITHSGIYIGNNKFIHTSSKNGVTITSLDDTWWIEKFVFATRVFK